MPKKYITIQRDERPPANDPNALVSVILPIYNTGAYLDQALNSVRGQTHDNLEIICVNDGSTDDSLETIRRHAAEDDRIVVIDKQNEGYGASCNRGIEAAHGEWIAIVEPDDWIKPGMYGDMLEFASGYLQRVDIIKTPYWRITNPGSPNEVTLNCPLKRRVKQSKAPFTIDECPELLRHHPCIWSAIYRREFLDKFNVRFMPIPGAGWADNPFLLESLCQARAIVYLDSAYYCYREDDADKTEQYHIKNWDVPLQRLLDMHDVLERLNVTDRGVLLAHTKRALMYVGGVLEVYDLDEKPEIREAIQRVFDTLDPELVLAEVDTEPGMKRLFFEMRGLPAPQMNELAYKAHVVGLGLYAVNNVGLKQAALAAQRYLTIKSRRAAGR